MTQFRYLLTSAILLAPAVAQQLDGSWAVSVYSLNPGGSFLIPNIALLDELGSSQLQRFDGKSDDFAKFQS